MPPSHARILVHLVFGVKERRPVITQAIDTRLHGYMAGVIRGVGCECIEVGGTRDHVHALFLLPRTLALATVVEKTKTASSRWMKEHVADFAWQSGYGAFSVGAREEEQIVQYIRNQPKHHAAVSFQDELRALLTDAGVQWDERYLWD